MSTSFSILNPLTWFGNKTVEPKRPNITPMRVLIASGCRQSQIFYRNFINYHSDKLQNCEFDLVTSIDSAQNLLEKNVYDKLISDLTFSNDKRDGNWLLLQAALCNKVQCRILTILQSEPKAIKSHITKALRHPFPDQVFIDVLRQPVEALKDQRGTYLL